MDLKTKVNDIVKLADIGLSDAFNTREKWRFWVRPLWNNCKTLNFHKYRPWKWRSITLKLLVNISPFTSSKRLPKMAMLAFVCYRYISWVLRAKVRTDGRPHCAMTLHLSTPLERYANRIYEIEHYYYFFTAIGRLCRIHKIVFSENSAEKVIMLYEITRGCFLIKKNDICYTEKIEKQTNKQNSVHVTRCLKSVVYLW